MKKIATIAAAAALTLAGAAGTAEAGHRGAAVAAGVGGLIGGMIIGSMLAPAPVYAEPVYVAPAYRPAYRPVRVADPHVAWCSRKYRSYSAYDNTWIDKYGRIRNCESPYGY